jgi:hypothetical protein
MTPPARVAFIITSMSSLPSKTVRLINAAVKADAVIEKNVLSAALY